jgi:hypothetical protein
VPPAPTTLIDPLLPALQETFTDELDAIVGAFGACNAYTLVTVHAFASFTEIV